MFEQAFKNIDDVLRKEAGCTTELDYTEQTSWLLFLKYLEDLEQDRATVAALEGKKYTRILDKPYQWESWAAPKGKKRAGTWGTGQVKSTYSLSGSALGYRVMSRRYNHDPYSDNEIDFLVAHIAPRNLWYVVPVKSIGKRAFLHLFPSGCNQAGGFFESYREAWHLMAAHGPTRPSK